jgi:hypothetical protein
MNVYPNYVFSFAPGCMRLILRDRTLFDARAEAKHLGLARGDSPEDEVEICDSCWQQSLVIVCRG